MLSSPLRSKAPKRDRGCHRGRTVGVPPGRLRIGCPSPSSPGEGRWTVLTSGLLRDASRAAQGNLGFRARTGGCWYVNYMWYMWRDVMLFYLFIRPLKTGLCEEHTPASRLALNCTSQWFGTHHLPYMPTPDTPCMVYLPTLGWVLELRYIPRHSMFV